MTLTTPNLGVPSRRSVLYLFVPGIPRPQGSKRGFVNKHTGRIAMVESSKHVKDWRADIRAAVAERLPAAAPFTAAVAAHLSFVMPRPKSHYRIGRNAHLLRDTAPPLPIGKPDIDKLERAILDAIGSAGLWVDDAQVTTVRKTKRYAGRGEPTGVLIEIRIEQEDGSYVS